MTRNYSRKRKYKFHGNQFSKEKKKSCTEQPVNRGDNVEVVEGLSASAKKVHLPNSPQVNCSQSCTSGYRMVSLEVLANVFQQVVCSGCGKQLLYLTEDFSRRKGCSSLLKLRCSSCGWTHSFHTSKKIKHFYEVNRRIVYGMRAIGKGAEAAKKFCGLMDMPPPPKPSAYQRHNKALMKVAKAVAEKTMAEAASEMRGNNPGISQCSVSCDGTWQRRGHSSLNGCVTVLSMETGKCLDIDILTKVCHVCRKINKVTDPDEKRLLEADHVGKYKSNFTGSAPSMETVGVKNIFQRSEDKHKLQYTEYFGDGDSKGFAEVQNVYQDKGVTVEKKECVGHVQKRVGSALRKLKKTTKGLGGKGKLTNAMIDRLQNYYGIAVRSNIGNKDKMKKAIHATLFHCASSKDNNYHVHCPDGSDSWCKFKRDKANRTSEYKAGPGLPKKVIKVVKPIFSRLSEDSLLDRCLDGKTQNQNESLNGVIWDNLPKNVFVGSDVLHLGVYNAVASFNIGCQASLNILQKAGIKPGKFCTKEMRCADLVRVKKANYKAKDEIKVRRKKLRAGRKHHSDKAEEKEGVTYDSGSF